MQVFHFYELATKQFTSEIKNSGNALNSGNRSIATRLPSIPIQTNKGNAYHNKYEYSVFDVIVFIEWLF